VFHSFATASPCDATSLRFAEVVTLAGTELSPLHGSLVDHIGAVACDPRACRPIPVQIDERDPSGAWVLDGGTPAGADQPPRIFDADDVLLFMASDAGESADADRLPADALALEIIVFDPLSNTDRRVYVLRYPEVAPRSARRYVSYDPNADRFSGARVSTGFAGGVPAFMSIDGGDNVLDRMKVRAAASLLWGWLRFTRDEDDLVTETVGWRAGPIRVLRMQTQGIHLGWGIRAPAFRSYTLFYRDFAELGVGLRLNRPATWFFGDILVEVVLDFRDLRGWRLQLPGRPWVVGVGETDADTRRALNRSEQASFVLIGPRLSLLHSFGFSDSLQSVRKRFIYRDDRTPDPPEAALGQRPGVGYALELWDEVGPGEHSLTALSHALPPDVDVADFIHARAVPLAVSVRPLHSSP
jgi:hypothetical protein